MHQCSFAIIYCNCGRVEQGGLLVNCLLTGVVTGTHRVLGLDVDLVSSDYAVLLVVRRGFPVHDDCAGVERFGPNVPRLPGHWKCEISEGNIRVLLQHSQSDSNCLYWDSPPQRAQTKLKQSESSFLQHPLWMFYFSNFFFLYLYFLFPKINPRDWKI